MLHRTNGSRSARVGLSAGLAVGLALVASRGFAQDATVGAGAHTAVPPAGAPAAPPPAPPPPPAAAAPAPAAVAPVAAPGGDDHDLWIGHVGVGWFGTTAVPDGSLGGLTPAGAQNAVNVPVVGIRYWATPMIGIDAGVGFASTSGSFTTNTAGNSVSVDTQSQLGFVLHGGVPIALGGGRHLSFQITPELNFGFGSGTIPGGGMAGNIDTNGFLFQLGARAGAEIYFGFIGIPQLALEGSVGLYLQDQSGKSSQGNNSTKLSALSIATSSIHQPWDIFTSVIAARYYF